jgi:small subunit ribosomal protein S1
MVDDHNPEYIESKPLNTEIETLSPEATEEHTSLSSESTHNPTDSTPVAAAQTPSENPASGAIAPSLSAATDTAEETGDHDYDDSDFAAALANFDREQAVESAQAQNLTQEEVVVTGTVVKITDKHAVIDIGLKSEGLLPLDQINNPDGTQKFAPGDTIEVVVEREETHGGGYIVSHEKALRHKVWYQLLPDRNVRSVKELSRGGLSTGVRGGVKREFGQ